MLILGFCALLAGPLDQAPLPAADTVRRVAVPAEGAAVARGGPDSTQQQPRRRAIAIGEWYSRRLTIHRVGAYAVLPVFGFQYLAGRQLYDKSSRAPTWAKTGHRVGATTLSALFTSNTVTGVWNLWDSRAVTKGRALRYAHALSMIAADAGFTYAGVKLSEQAETDPDKRRLHRTIALTSMGVTLSSGLMMRIWNR